MMNTILLPARRAITGGVLLVPAMLLAGCATMTPSSQNMAPIFPQNGAQAMAGPAIPASPPAPLYPSAPASPSAPAPVVPPYPAGPAAPMVPPYPGGGAAPAPMGAPQWQAAGQPTRSEIAGGALLYESRAQGPAGVVELSYVVFDSRHYSLRVIDQASPTAGGGMIGSAMQYHGAAAGVNGGFFTSAFEPVGLMIASGRQVGSYTGKSSLITGMVLVAEGVPYLIWKDEYQGPQGVTDLLQSGPRLVSSSRPVSGLNASKSSNRSFVATDGRQLWAIGVARNCTLASLAEVLCSAQAFSEFPVMRALNLDGGHSSALWAKLKSGREISLPGWSTVRNYIGIIPRR